MKKFLLVFLILALVIGVNLSHGMLSEVGMNGNVLIGTLIALVIAGLVSTQGFGLIVLVVVATIAANVPPQIARSIGYDRDIMLAVLVALIILPIIAKQF